jgi:hypothetical protein
VTGKLVVPDATEVKKNAVHGWHMPCRAGSLATHHFRRALRSSLRATNFGAFHTQQPAADCRNRARRRFVKNSCTAARRASGAGLPHQSG